jgi:hypothetical protein
VNVRSTSRGPRSAWSGYPASSSEHCVAPALDCPGALGRVKGPLAMLAAAAPLTRPARSLGGANTERRHAFATSRTSLGDVVRSDPMRSVCLAEEQAKPMLERLVRPTLPQADSVRGECLLPAAERPSVPEAVSSL